MDVIDDKEIGELWTDSSSFYGDTSQAHWKNKYKLIIHKLVKERAHHFKRSGHRDAMDHALRDFNIDPATFPGGHGW